MVICKKQDLKGGFLQNLLIYFIMNSTSHIVRISSIQQLCYMWMFVVWWVYNYDEGLQEEFISDGLIIVMKVYMITIQ